MRILNTIRILVRVFALLSGATQAYAQAYTSTNFYIVAHEDDWQLFMNPNAYYDAQDRNAKVVFVYVTAGDEGNGDKVSPPRTVPYFLARENGANSAVSFMADVGTLPKQPILDKPVIEGHSLHRIVYKNTVSYFFRLPDGGSGKGFPNTGDWSLDHFRTAISPAGSVDGLARYNSWSDLVRTVRQLITNEIVSTNTWINISESDASLNPKSHADHISTSLLVQEAIGGVNCLNRAFYVDYSTNSKPINLSLEDQQIKSAAFAVTVAAVTRMGYESTWEPLHRSWLGRQYLRVDRSRDCQPPTTATHVE